MVSDFRSSTGKEVTTDAGGEFVVETLIPGRKFVVTAFARGKTYEPPEKAFAAESGRTTDLGTIPLRAYEEAAWDKRRGGAHFSGGGADGVGRWVMASRTAAALKRVVRSVAQVDPPAVADRELLRRFADEDDQAAFAALARRHCGMVLGVCRRALAQWQDAEDACQATFLLLARKAKSVRWQPSVANYLYVTARKVAHNARVSAQRRARREARAAVPESVPPVDRMSGRELLVALDEELNNLPPRYREPLVLHYLEGLTQDEAAARLGVLPSTLRTRLDRGRKRLGGALTKRGWALGAGLLALAATSPAGASPPRLINSVLAAALGTPPGSVADLAKGVAVNGIVNKAVLGLAAVISVVALGVGLGSLKSNAAGQPPQPEQKPAQLIARGDAKPDGAPPGEDAAESRTYRGRVLGPDGKPVAGAKLYLTPANGYPGRVPPSPEQASTGRDGRFAFTVPQAKDRYEATVVTATATDHGVAWVVPLLEARGKTDDLTLRLVDDVPITGRIVDLEGKPVPGATLRVLSINASPQEDLGPWLEAARGKKGLVSPLEHRYLPRYTISLSPTATTDTQGRFRLTGLGRERLVRVLLQGPTLASQELHILTRPEKPLEVTASEGRPEYGDPRQVITYYGADFRHAAAPTKPVVGVVRDKDTMKPLPGVRIQTLKLADHARHYQDGQEIAWTTTDAEGRYRLTGLPKGNGSKIKFVPSGDRAYIAISADVPDSPGLDPVTVDVELKRGVWIEGKITDKVTGKPLKGAVAYIPLASNPNFGDYPGFQETFPSIIPTKEDGSYRVAVLPGPGVVGVYYQRHPYLRAPDREDEFGYKEPADAADGPNPTTAGNTNALVRINPDKGVESVKRDVTIDPGWRLTATVLGPDGKPLAGTRGFGLTNSWWDHEAMKSAEFKAWFNPRRPSDILVHHQEQGLVGVAKPPKEDGGTVTVRMEPGATVTGRLVDAAGKPRAGVELAVAFRPKGWGSWVDFPPERIKTDVEGRFRVGALLPGYRYNLHDDQGSVEFGDGLRPGAVKDLGDVKAAATD